MAKDLTAALHALTEEANGQSSRKDTVLPPAKPVAPIPERVGQSANTPSAGTGGIASPLVETAYADRTWHANTALLTTDGVFALLVRRVKTVNYEDARRAPVVIENKAPA